MNKRTLSLLLCLMVGLAQAALAGRQVDNESGHLDGMYTQVTVRDLSNNSTLAKGAKVNLHGKQAFVFLPDPKHPGKFEKPFEARAVLFYDWGYQLEVTVYYPKAGRRYDLLCPTGQLLESQQNP